MSRVVLVADDSPTIQKRVQGILKGEGFEVETVSNGVAAVKRLAFLRPVVILADVSMPGRDGYEVCDFVKNSSAHAHVPVLLIASDMEPYDESRGAQVRADGKIIKPFDAQDLIYTVEKLAAQCEASAAAGGTRLMPVPTLGPPEVHRSEETAEPPVPSPPSATELAAESEGVAFAEHAVKTDESQPIESQFDAPIAPPASEPKLALGDESEIAIFQREAVAPILHDDLLAFEAPAAFPLGDRSASSPEPFTTSSIGEIPLVCDEPGGVDAEPVLIEEHAVPPVAPFSSPPAKGTRSFRTPLELLDPVWPPWDGSAAAAPQGGSIGSVAPEPQLEPESPAATAELTAQQSEEAELLAPPVAAISLENFSLEDLSAAQRGFVSEQLEGSLLVAAPLVDIAPLEDFTELASPAVPSVEPAPPPEASTEPPAQPVTEVSTSPETEPPGEPMAEVAAPPEAPTESVPEPGGEVSRQGGAEPPAGPVADFDPSLEAPMEGAAEATAEVTLPLEAPTDASVEHVAEVASRLETPTAPSDHPMAEVARRLDAATELLAELVAEFHPSLEAPTESMTETAETTAPLAASTVLPADPAVEVAPSPDASTAPPAEVAAEVHPPPKAPAEPPAHPAGKILPVVAEGLTEAPAPAPPPDLNLVSSIVRRVVVRMCPPALPREAVEEMATRLAYEIALELAHEAEGDGLS